MDYIDYLNEQIERRETMASEMERYGCETEEEYYDLLESQKADYQERMMEMRRMDED